MQIGSLFMALGFDVDDKKLDGFSGKINGLKAGLGGIAGVAAAGVGALSAMSLAGAEVSLELSNASAQTLQTTDDIQRLVNVAQGMNPTLTRDRTVGMVSSLFDTMVAAEWGLGATGDLNMMGVDAMAQDSVFAMVTEFRRAWRENPQGLSEGRRMNIMSSAGLPKEFIGMITATENRFKELLSRDIRAKEDIKDHNELSKEIQAVTHQLKLLSFELGTNMTGSLKDLAGFGATFLKATRDKLKKDEKDSEALKANPLNPVVNDPLGDMTQFEGWFRAISPFIGYDPDGWIKTRMQEGLPVPEREIRRMGLEGKYLNTTNNINIESTADAKDLTESVFETIEMQQNKSIAGELPNVSQAGIR